MALRILPNPYPAGSPEYWMREALALAQRGFGWDAPNPSVGCVLLREGRLIGQGWHTRVGALHAETMALADAQKNGGAKGADAYATLEPCSHVGRQPPCCSALIAAGVRSVTIGCEDAFPPTAGAAKGILSSAGIEVHTSNIRRECELFLEHYLVPMREERCYAHLKLALSLDARIACANGQSKWLSSAQSHGLAHFLRQKYDAVLVGAGTLRVDHPQLTVRAEVLEAYLDSTTFRLRDPVRVIIDQHFETLALLAQSTDPAELPATLRRSERQREDLPWLIIAGDRRHLPDAPRPEGVQLLGLQANEQGLLSFAQLYKQLYELGLRSLLIEGGAALATEVLRQETVDSVTFVYTPHLIGREGLDFSPPLGSTNIAGCPRLADQSVEVLGPDVAISGRPVWPTDISRLEES